LTYAELDRRGRHLAGVLRDRGAAPGTLVAVGLPPGVDLVTTLLAVLHTGAAYLPLDPGYPTRRLAYLLADSAAAILVTAGAQRDRFPASGFAVVDVDHLMWTHAASDAAPAPDAAGAADRIAAVIYTSGSTGQPKAVRVPYSALASRVRWMRAHYGITAADRVLQFASPSFDTYGEEVYPALAAGATVVIPAGQPIPDGAVRRPDGERAELPDFLTTPAGRAVTVLDLPTSYWHELVADPRAVAWPPGLRLLILGGEQVRSDALARWFEVFADRVEVVNTYGPTEATIIATATRLTAADAVGRPPIGHPIADTCVHILTAAGDPVPDGIPGELVIGGAGVAAGYLGRPELTAARFAPYQATAHYRTGDRVRRRPDGALEFLGRLDDQVKVRGYRVEPGEVEAALTEHPAVRHAVVTVDGAGRLVAHLVPPPDAGPPGPAELRDHLADRLPAHLHPQAYAILDHLPMTRHGKVDHSALPAIAAGGERASTVVPPRTDGERLVARVWGEVLGVEAIGAHDDFFDLGGHSLLATRVAARLRSATGVDVSLRTIFHRTTVAELAGAVEELLIAEIEALDDDEVQRLLNRESQR